MKQDQVTKTLIVNLDDWEYWKYLSKKYENESMSEQVRILIAKDIKRIERKQEKDIILKDRSKFGR